ncbi:MAG: bifunctional hydroxymethylpyrimidine kinase/phosphomethylpyrimidine kinase [Lentisphaeria bacterium]|nr:bifunctional hydroxymethylpyrimidine kinase/phosphomethylpyrimidine kinase [Lentisphaeria bacterium]
MTCESHSFQPVALSIAGSDSGGGAGIQADLRAFTAFGVFGATAVTAVTAQNPTAVTGVQGVTATILRQQIQAVRAAFAVGAVKIGMLFSAELITVVADELADWDVPLVIDPVMIATSGARLLPEAAVRALKERLIPRATLITPNIPEARALTADADADGPRLASQLLDTLGVPVLVKGGHNRADRSTDILATPEGIWRLSSPVIDAPATHGTGCSLSSACAAALSIHPDTPLIDVVRQGKAYVFGALKHCARIGEKTWTMWPAPNLPIADISVTRL